MANARIERGVYKCEFCQKAFGRKEVQADHKLPVVPVTGWDSWDGYIDRMFPDDASGWQLLCKSCHKVKTLKENEIRKSFKDAAKKINQLDLETSLNSPISPSDESVEGKITTVKKTPKRIDTKRKSK